MKIFIFLAFVVLLSCLCFLSCAGEKDLTGTPVPKQNSHDIGAIELDY